MLYHTASGTAINMTEMREKIHGAARPSEPSAPKVEPQFTCENCVSPEVCSERMHCDKAGRPLHERPTQTTETASAPQLGQLLGEVLVKAGVLHGEFPLTEDQITFAAKEYLAAPSLAGTQPTTCKARAAGTAGGNYPQDCDWPFCGCDERATKAMETLLECGWIGNKEAAELRRELAVEKELSARLAEKEVDQAIRAESAEAQLETMKSGAAQGTPQVEEAVEAIMRLGYTRDRVCQRDAVRKALRPFFPEHLVGAPAQPGPEDKKGLPTGH